MLFIQFLDIMKANGICELRKLLERITKVNSECTAASKFEPHAYDLSTIWIASVLPPTLQAQY